MDLFPYGFPPFDFTEFLEKITLSKPSLGIGSIIKTEKVKF